MEKPIAYQLSPVDKTEGSMGTACMMECVVTGAILSGSGGGGYFISPEVFELLTRDVKVQTFIRESLMMRESPEAQ